MRTVLALIPIAAVALATTPAFADRDPTAEERTAIEQVLQAEGFTRWDDIEFDDDDQLWEVEDAVDAENKEWDLKLDAAYAITRRDPD